MLEKLSEEQLRNWRRILPAIIGPGALYMSDELIEAFRNNLQKEVLRRYEDPKAWQLVIRIFGDGRPWTEIEPGPITPPCPYNTILGRSMDLIKKYWKIEAIQILDESGMVIEELKMKEN